MIDDLERDDAEQLAIALTLHLHSRRNRGLTESPALKALCADAIRRAKGAGGSTRRPEVQPPQAWITTADVAEMVGVHKATVKRWLSDGFLPSTKLGRVRRIHRHDLQRLIDERTQRGDQPR